MVNNENNALKKVNNAFNNQKLHCQLVNSRGKVLATTNKTNAAKSHNNLNLKTNGNGANGNGANAMNGGKSRKGRKGGDMGLTTLIMPAGVNPFLTTIGLAALSGTSKGKRLVSDVNPVGRRKRSTRKRSTRKRSVSALSLNAPVKKRKRSVSKSKGRKRSVTTTVTKRKVVRSRPRKRSVSKTVTRKVSRSRPRKRSASKSKGRKRSVSKSRTRKVRKGGNMMSLLFPRGLSASLTAAGLAGLAKTGHLGRSSLSKSRRTSRKRSGSRTVKKRKVVRRKVQSGGKVKRKTSVKKRKTSVKKRKTSVKKRPTKRKTSVKKRKTSRGGACWASEKNSMSQSRSSKKKRSGGNCPWASVGGAKKKKVNLHKKVSKKKHRGGSDWRIMTTALGPTNAGDMTPCGPAVCVQKAFTSQPIVPNSQLANWIAPQSTGTVGSMCGGMSKLKKKRTKTALKSLKKRTKTAKKSLKKRTKAAKKSLKKKAKTIKRKTTRK